MPELSTQRRHPPSQRRRLSLLLALNVVLIAGLVVVGLVAHSVSVLASGADFLADSLAILLGLVAVHLRDRHGNTQAPTYVALANAVLLLIVTVGVVAESVRRLLLGAPEVAGVPTLVVALISAVAMGVGALILGRTAGDEDLHMRSVLLDTLTDGLASAAVAVVGVVIAITHGLYWLDPAAAILIGCLTAVGAVKLLLDVIRALHRGTAFPIDDD